jgi:hypothetical protein
VIASLLAMSHINRFSHVVMDGSPVKFPLGLKGIKSAARHAARQFAQWCHEQLTRVT